MATDGGTYRPPHYAHDGGCACKIPPCELDAVVADLVGGLVDDDLLVGLETGDDAAVVRLTGDLAIVSTADFFTPVVDDPYDWGRTAAANALSDVYAVGGRPLVAVNLLGWPRDVLPFELAKEVLRSGLAIAHEAQCQVGGGHSIDDPEPKYGMAVTDPARLLRNDAGAVGDVLSLRKSLGGGRAEQPAQANRRGVPAGGRCDDRPERGRLASGAGHRRTRRDRCHRLRTVGPSRQASRASGVAAVIEAAAVPHLDASRQLAAAGYISGGTQRNLAWVKAHTDFGSLPELEQLLLADAQTSGGLLLAAELPGCRVIGELVERTESSGPSTTLWCASERVHRVADDAAGGNRERRIDPPVGA
jgi:selenide, water dikinase